MNDPQSPGPEKKAKRPYEKPALHSFELFERRTLTCTVTQSTGRNPSCGVYHSSVA